jgi:hypothetical protein
MVAFSERLLAELSIPNTVLALTPKDNLEQVQELWTANEQLPSKLRGLFFMSHTALVSMEPPDTHNEVLILSLGSLPLEKVEKAIQFIKEREATGDRYHSVIHPDKPKLRFPLWTLRLSEALENRRREGMGWKDICGWVKKKQKQKRKQALMREAQVVLDIIPTLPWNTSIRVGGYNVEVAMLRRLLQEGDEGWLNTSLMDVSIGCLRARVQEDKSVRDTVMLEDLGVWEMIRKGNFTSRTLTNLISRAGSGDVGKRLLIVINLNQHWFALMVDFRHNLITYGQLYENMVDYNAHLPYRRLAQHQKETTFASHVGHQGGRGLASIRSS